MDKIRKCECGKEIKYATAQGYNMANTKQSKCKSCAKIGENNSFYNKKHTKKSIKKMSKAHTGKPVHSQNFKDDLRMRMTNHNPMSGKSFYDVWVQKYGKTKADKLLVKYKNKKSLASSGKNNPMYGKPSPQGSGNGWSGWYNGWYFRSLRELSYMVNVIEKNELQWESGEQKKWAINYIDWNGVSKTYFSDFIIGGHTMVECKPINLIKGSKTVKLKTKFAKKFCIEHNMKYIITDVSIMCHKDIKQMHYDGKIKFLDRYENKFKEKYLNIK